MNESETVSLARYTLLRGWAKYLSYASSIEKEMDVIAKLRENSFGIAIRTDWRALQWQRLDFQLHRARYAVGMYGLTRYATCRGSEWIRVSQEELDRNNQKSFDKQYRQKSHRAKKLLSAAGVLHCDSCHDQGYYLEGDQDYPCPDCQIPGIIDISNPNWRSELKECEG